jgi:Flp pilus assembly protein TadG
VLLLLLLLLLLLVPGASYADAAASVHQAADTAHLCEG